MSSLYAAIAICGSSIVSCSSLPQIVHVSKRKSTEGISFYYQVKTVFLQTERSFSPLLFISGSRHNVSGSHVVNMNREPRSHGLVRGMG